MRINYIEPLSRAWDRMKKSLFQPFDIQKWFIVGFTSFLAGLIDGNPLGNFNNSVNDRRDISVYDIERFPERTMDWINFHPFLFMLILAAVVIIITIVVVLT